MQGLHETLFPEIRRWAWFFVPNDGVQTEGRSMCDGLRGCESRSEA